MKTAESEVQYNIEHLCMAGPTVQRVACGTLLQQCKSEVKSTEEGEKFRHGSYGL